MGEIHVYNFVFKYIENAHVKLSSLHSYFYCKITTKSTAGHQTEGIFLCLVLVINGKPSNTLVVRVQQVEESGPLFPPVGRALLRHHGASFLGL